LPQPARATEETSRRTINQDGEMYRGNAMHYPRTPFLSKTTYFQHVKKKIPVNIFKILLNIQLAKQPKFARLDTTIQTFASNENQVQNLPTFNKSVTRLWNDLLHDTTHSISKDFSNEGLFLIFKTSFPLQNWALISHNGLGLRHKLHQTEPTQFKKLNPSNPKEIKPSSTISRAQSTSPFNFSS